MMTSNPTISVYQYTSPTFEPLELPEVKRHLELAESITAHDALLESLSLEARETVEHDTCIVGATRSFIEKLDNWPATWIELHRKPVSSVTSITYIDTGGTTQTWTATEYALDLYRVWPSIRLAYSKTWPSLRGDESGIVITYVAGYATRALIPRQFKQAMLLRIAESFGDRTGRGDDPSNTIIGRNTAYERLIQRLMRNTYP